MYAARMEEYLSTTPIWHALSEKISALDGKSILIVRSDHDVTEADVRVESAPPYSPDRGKVSVRVGGCHYSDEPWEPVTMNPTTPPEYSDMVGWQRFLTKAALDLIRPRTSEWPSSAELLLVLPTSSR